MEVGRIESLKRQLKRSKNPLELDEVVKELLQVQEGCPKVLIDVLREKILQGMLPTQTILVAAVVAWKDKQLYEASKSHIFDEHELCSLLKAGIPDADIERRLCSCLDENHDGDMTWSLRRVSIVEALRDAGSIECLETLQAMEYDHDGRYKTASLVLSNGGDSPNSIDPFDFEKQLKSAQNKIDFNFGELLRQSISRVRTRNTPVPSNWVRDHDMEDNFFSSALVYIEKSNGHLNSDLDASANHLRKALEALLKEIIRTAKVEVTKKDLNVNHAELKDLVPIIHSEYRLPKEIATYIESVQRISTQGSHEQGKPVDEHLSGDIIRGEIAKLKFVVKYFREQFAKY